MVSLAGLVAAAHLAQRLWVAELIDERVDLAEMSGAPDVDVKAMVIIEAMLAGADSIGCDAHGRHPRQRPAPGLRTAGQGRACSVAH